MAMQIHINGQVKQILSPSLSLLLAEETTEQVFAVAVNGAFVARHDYQHFQLNQGDQVEILSPMQGG